MRREISSNSCSSGDDFPNPAAIAKLRTSIFSQENKPLTLERHRVAYQFGVNHPNPIQKSLSRRGISGPNEKLILRLSEVIQLNIFGRHIDDAGVEEDLMR
jgi:hypothetical protein